MENTRGTLSNILLAVFIAFAFVNNVLAITIPAAIFLFISLLIALSSDRDGIIAFVMCCIPFSTVFQYKYAILICVIVYGVRFNHDLKMRYIPFALFMMMFLWESLHLFVYNDFSAIELVRSFVEIFFLLFLMSNSYRDYNYPRIVRWYSISSVSVCLFILMNQVRNYSISNILHYYTIQRFGVSTVDEGTFIASFNPNVLAIICIIGIACLIQIIIEKQQLIIDYVLISLLTIFAMMTMSIKVLTLPLVIFVLSAVDQKRHPLKIIQIMLLSVILVAVSIAILNHYLPTVIDHFMERTQADDISNGRTNLFAEYNEYSFSRFDRLFFGIGLQDNLIRLGAIGLANVPHNGLQELIVVWGIPGLLMFIAFLGQFFTTIGRSLKDIPVRKYIPFVVMIAFVQLAQMITNGRYLLLFAMSYLSLASHTTDEERTKEYDTYKTGAN